MVIFGRFGTRRNVSGRKECVKRKILRDEEECFGVSRDVLDEGEVSG